jgi:hypothetical protein
MKTLIGIFGKKKGEDNVAPSNVDLPPLLSTKDKELIRRKTLMMVVSNTLGTLEMIGHDKKGVEYGSLLDQYICEDLKTGPDNCQEIEPGSSISNKGIRGFRMDLTQLQALIESYAINDKRLVEGQYENLDNVFVPAFIEWLKEMKSNLEEYQKTGMTKAGWVMNRNPRFSDDDIYTYKLAIEQGLEALTERSRDYKMCKKIAEEDEKLKSIQEKKRRDLDLNAFWDQKCTSDPEWIDSLFCKMGYGNQMAELVMQMRFSLPVNPNKHVLKTLYNMGLPRTTLDLYLKKIDCDLTFRWADLANIVRLLNGFLGIVDKHVVPYGLTFKQPRHYQGQTRKIDLNSLHNQKCSKSGDWKDTLFCEMGYSNRAAEFIGRMKFSIPCIVAGNTRKCSDPKNNAVLIILDKIIDAASGNNRKYNAIADW